MLPLSLPESRSAGEEEDGLVRCIVVRMKIMMDRKLEAFKESLSSMIPPSLEKGREEPVATPVRGDEPRGGERGAGPFPMLRGAETEQACVPTPDRGETWANVVGRKERRKESKKGVEPPCRDGRRPSRLFRREPPPEWRKRKRRLTSDLFSLLPRRWC